MSQAGANNAAAMGYAGVGMQLAGNLGSAWEQYVLGRARESQYRRDAERLEIAAGELDQTAESAVKSAGEAQLAGREEAAMRGLRLSQDIGRVFSGSAGAGVDVSSATVRHVAKGMRDEGYRDQMNMYANAANRANAYVDQAMTQRKNAIWQRADAEIARINAKAARRSGTWAALGGMVSAVGSAMYGGAMIAK